MLYIGYMPYISVCRVDEYAPVGRHEVMPFIGTIFVLARGFISDKFGRKPVALLYAVLAAVGIKKQIRTISNERNSSDLVRMVTRRKVLAYFAKIDYSIRMSADYPVHKTIRHNPICLNLQKEWRITLSLLDKVKELPTLNELKGGFGEYLTKFMAQIDIPELLVIHDVMIDGYQDQTSQTDLLLIGEKGIYVSEVKLYPDAKIYGDGKKSQWYYYKGGHKYNIYSPIKQNQNHIKHLKQFLKDFGDIPCFSVIVMLCDDFKVNNINEDPNNPDTVILNGLLNLRKGIQLLAKGKPTALTKEQQQTIFEYINANQHKGKEIRLEHKERVSAIKEEKMAAAQKNLCPYCKQPLVLRKGKYGEFYGCSNFPACKYTQTH